MASLTFSFRAASYKYLREMSFPRVADNRAYAGFAHTILGELVLLLWILNFSPSCVAENIFG